MIKARANGANGKPIVLLGLTRHNTANLLAGLPMRIDLSELGIEGMLLIVGGDTEAAIMTELRDFITPTTEIHGGMPGTVGNG